MKITSNDMLRDARAAITQIELSDAKALHGNPDYVFVDVRERHEREAGFIPGSVHATRGLIEFYLDPASDFHLPQLGTGRKLVFYCASGGRSALVARTAQEMGIEGGLSLLGGFKGWKAGGGPVDT